MRIDESVEQYMEYCKNVKALSKSSLKMYRHFLMVFMDFAGRERDVAEIERDEIKAFINNLSRSMMPASVKLALASLKSFFSWLWDMEIIEDVPTDRVRCAKKEYPDKIKAMPRTDMSKYMRAVYAKEADLRGCGGDEEYMAVRGVAIVETLFATGMRISELVSLSWEHFRRDDESFSIIGKGEKRRRVWLNRESVNALRHYYEVAGYEWIPEEGPVFRNKRHERVGDSKVRMDIEEYGRAAGLNYTVNPHMLRHTFASLQLEAGTDIRELQSLLGHSSIVVTELYIHISEEHLRSILEKSNIRSMLDV